ncbi:MAG: hypothetical protein C4295_03005 [Candidatus Fervidibacterota bacterium]
MRQGMTLIELLVVIAVILVIVGITYRVLSHTRERAHLATCISNLRQLVLAVHMYEQDWGTVPIELSAPVQTPEGIWGVVAQKLYPTYVKSKSVFLCPSDPTGGRLAPNLPGRSPILVVWRGEKWPNSYTFLVNDFVVKLFGKGNPRLKSQSPLFICAAHRRFLGVILIARYDGSILLHPPVVGKLIRAEFEVEGGKKSEEDETL